MGDHATSITHLSQARDIVLRDPAIYPQVLPAVLAVVGSGAHLDLRRWGAHFFAEMFASPVVSAEEKQKMAFRVLDILQSYLNRKEQLGEEEDATVVKSAVQCSTSIYPLVFKHTIANAADKETWSKMAGIKSSILKRIDTATAGVRICCIKFVAGVVLVQTPGLIADPRRPDQNEVSLALVPRDHPTIPPANLEAEASGLLDRLLYVLQENVVDPLIITATLNALGVLVQKRASISNKILSTVFTFNPLKPAEGSGLSGTVKVAIRSMTRTTITFLLNVLKRNQQHNLAGRIQQHVEGLKHGLVRAFSERQNNLKRPAPDEPIDGLDDAKRQRVDEEAAKGTTPQQQPAQYPPLPPGPVSLAQLFTLTQDQVATNFHVERLPQQIVAQLIPPLLAAVNQMQFDDAVNAVRARFLNLSKQAPEAAPASQEDDEDYDPTQDAIEAIRPDLEPDDIIAPFQLGPSHALDDYEKSEYSQTAVIRIFNALKDLDQEARTKPKKITTGNEADTQGFASLPTITRDRDSWLTLLTRIATRSTFALTEPGPQEDNNDIKASVSPETGVVIRPDGSFNLANAIRESLYNYVTEDFRRRLDVALNWLNEEWYVARLAQKQRTAVSIPPLPLPHLLADYYHYATRLLDFMIPYFDVKDGKYLTRFLAELPFLDQSLLDRAHKIADDPERVPIAVTALVYLAMFRPPVKEAALDVLEAMWRGNEDAREVAGKHLRKLRPGVFEGEGVKKEEGGEGV
ncbi:hypothetical protein MBLNU230_g5755t1 [Neophaeotheca triangularis]